jgi:hypothetical protein
LLVEERCAGGESSWIGAELSLSEVMMVLDKSRAVSVCLSTPSRANPPIYPPFLSTVLDVLLCTMCIVCAQIPTSGSTC